MSHPLLTPPLVAGSTGRLVRIAVIDSGIHGGHPHVGGISGAVAFDAAGAGSDDVLDRLGHGTAVAGAIREKAPGADLLSVKVFHDALRTTGAALVAAIRWAAAARAALINLSLGTTNADHAGALADAVAEAAAYGSIVVAAAPEPDAAWLPGGLPGVVSVEVDWELSRETVVLVEGDEGRGSLRLRASGYPRPIPGVPPARNFQGPSFAVANATGLLALVMEGRTVRTIDELANAIALVRQARQVRKLRQVPGT